MGTEIVSGIGNDKIDKRIERPPLFFLCSLGCRHFNIEVDLQPGGQPIMFNDGAILFGEAFCRLILVDFTMFDGNKLTNHFPKDTF